MPFFVCIPTLSLSLSAELFLFIFSSSSYSLMERKRRDKTRRIPVCNRRREGYTQQLPMSHVQVRKKQVVVVRLSHRMNNKNEKENLLNQKKAKQLAVKGTRC